MNRCRWRRNAGAVGSASGARSQSQRGGGIPPWVHCTGVWVVWHFRLCKTLRWVFDARIGSFSGDVQVVTCMWEASG